MEPIVLEIKDPLLKTLCVLQCADKSLKNFFPFAYIFVLAPSYCPARCILFYDVHAPPFLTHDLYTFIVLS